MRDFATDTQVITNRRLSFAYAALVLGLLLLALALYTLLHEGGHAIVGLLSGGTLKTFNVSFLNLDAHVSLDGSFTPAQNALISVAGISLPLLLGMAFILLTPSRSESVLTWFRAFVFLISVNTLLAWIVIPLLAMRGQQVADDSYGFLTITRIPPLLLTAAALVIYLLAWYLFLHHVGGLNALVNAFRRPVLDFRTSQTRQTLLVLAVLAVLVAGTGIGASRAFPDRAPGPPEGYQPVAQIQLAQARLQDQVIYAFTLAAPSSVNFYFILDQIKSGPVQIHLSGPAGYDNIFMSIQDPQVSMGHATVHPTRIVLQPGTYEIRVTFQPTPGQMSAYIKIE